MRVNAYHQPNNHKHQNEIQITHQHDDTVIEWLDVNELAKQYNYDFVARTINVLQLRVSVIRHTECAIAVMKTTVSRHKTSQFIQIF